MIQDASVDAARPVLLPQMAGRIDDSGPCQGRGVVGLVPLKMFSDRYHDRPLTPGSRSDIELIINESPRLVRLPGDGAVPFVMAGMDGFFEFTITP